MKKLMLGSLLGLLAFGLSPAQAQFYFRPTTNPLQPPYFNPFNPYNPYSFYGNPAARPPGTVGAAPGFAQPGFMGGSLTTAQAVVPLQNLGDPSMTGHPTRFFDYSTYFFNQGGTTAVAPGLPTTGATGVAAPPAGVPAIGTAPLRGRANTKTGS